METDHTTGRVLVTSGPTRAWLDRVRFIANSSTGALGAHIVEALVARGIPVRHVYGLGAQIPSIADSPLLESAPVETIGDLIEEIRTSASSGSIRAVVHAMAVLDYIPERDLGGKRSSGTETWDLHLVRTPKVTSLIRETMPCVPVIGFKLEAGISEKELVRRGIASLRKYGLALVVANDIDRIGGGQHEALIIDPRGTVLTHAHTKQEIADRIAAFIEEHVTFH